MNWYESVKFFYDRKRYDEKDVYYFVEKGLITQEEAETIIVKNNNK